MEKKIIFGITESNNLQEKIIYYFTHSGFMLLQKEENEFKFNHTSSIFNTWYFNPLKWKSNITVNITTQQIKVDCKIDNDAQMNSWEEENVWNAFLKNFELYLLNNIDFTVANSIAIRESRKSALKYIGWAATGAILGGAISILLSEKTGMTISTYLLIPFCALLLLNNRIRNKKIKSIG